MSSNDLISDRLSKLDNIQKQGVNPYPSISVAKTLISDVRTKDLDNVVHTAGRIMSFREHGKIVFMDLMDASGRIQIAFKLDTLGSEKFEFLKSLDMGDFISVTGALFKTKTEELTINVTEYQLLTKSLRPLPNEWHGLKDVEDRYRQRYVDFILNPDLRDLFRKKSLFWNSIRDFMLREGFLEVETPVLENTAGGADANPFITHHNALDIDVYLRISMGELWQKRLMVSGFEKTFEIGRQFRNEGISREHLQDYTQMEFYWAYANYQDSMKLVEQMYKEVAYKVFGTYEFEINGHKVNLKQEWGHLSYKQALLNEYKLDITVCSIEDLQAELDKLEIEYAPNDGRGRLIDLLWKVIRKKIAGPVFLVDHPVEVSPLAKRKTDNPDLVERYQIILAGSEMGNGYSELNDPIDQGRRFMEQQAMRESGDDEAQMYDHDFVRALEYGMPPVTGFGVSERLFSFLADKSVRECVMFPLLRPESKNDNIVAIL